MQQSLLVLFLGALLMAGCGSVIALHLGFTGSQSFFVVGFAVGVILLGQAPAIALRSRITQLEAKLAALTNNAA